MTECMQKCMVYTKLHFCHTVLEAQQYEEVERKADSLKGYMLCGLYSIAYRQKFEAFLACNTKGYNGYFTLSQLVLIRALYIIILFKKVVAITFAPKIH